MSARPGAELVLVGGRIMTMDPGRPAVDAVSVGGGRIVGVGRREALATGGARVVDLDGRVLVPETWIAGERVFAR